MNPRNVKMYNNYGLELKAAGRIIEAEQSYLVGGKFRKHILILGFLIVITYSVCQVLIN